MNLILVYILRHINNNPGHLPEFFNWMYLTNARTIYTVSSAFVIMSFIVNNTLTEPISQLLGNSFWYPFSRLTYGAYLSHSTFMLFRNYNSERGIWGSQFDAVLYFFAYLTLAFVFSLIITLLVETPCLRLYKEFFRSANAMKEAASLGQKTTDDDLHEALNARSASMNRTGTGSIHSDGAESLDSEQPTMGGAASFENH